ncbi:MAG TPA: murein biosynthesis integral membrane protein MurJ [Anaerolineae bacterium]|nr:murein biosynthesis integral membrane protein MurJ [Anaerolineae bacterium]
MPVKVKTTHLIRSAGILMAAFLVNKVLAIGRQIVIARAFGTGSDYDAFVAAFRLPDILFMLISGGALATAFIPILSERVTLRSPNDPDGWRLTSATLNTILLLVTVAAALVAVLALPLVQWLIAPGFPPETQLLTANLMRLALVSTIIFSVSGLVGGVLHVHQHFLLPALAPIIYNLGIIAGAIFLAPTFGVYGLMWGAIAGAAGHLLIQVPGLIRYRMTYFPILGWHDSGVHQVARLMGPRLLTIGVIQINFLVIFNLASRLGEGSVSALDYGWDLMQVPQTIIGSAIGIVLFPTMAALAAQGDLVGLRRTTSQALRIILALSIPAMVGLIVLGQPVIQLMFERGEFGPDSTAAVYQSLQFWALALVGHCALEVVNRLFYAQKDTTTPLLGALAGMVINIILAVALYQVLGAGGLALSNGVAVTVEVLILLVIAHWRMAGVEAGPMISTLARTLLAAGAMGAVMLIFTTLWPALPPFIIAVGGGFLGLIVYIGAGLLLGIEEIRMAPRLVGR